MAGEAQMSWSEVLGLVQQIAPAVGWAFTTSDLEKAGLNSKVAARWLTKFVDWGYIARGEFEESAGAGRPRRFYHMLKRGLDKDITMIGKADFERLVEAVEQLQSAEGEKEQSKAYQNLIKTKDDLLDERKKRLEKKPKEEAP